MLIAEKDKVYLGVSPVCMTTALCKVGFDPTEATWKMESGPLIYSELISSNFQSLLHKSKGMDFGRGSDHALYFLPLT